MQHRGWQQIVHHYSWKSKINWGKGNLRKKLDRIRIRAIPADGSNDTATNYAIFDAIQFNTPRDFRDARNPVTQVWSPIQPDFSTDTPPTPDELKKLSQLESFLSQKSNPKVKDEHWKKRLTGIQKRIEDEGLSSGHSIKKNLGHYFGFLNQIAGDFSTCANPELRRQFAKKFIAVNSWMQDQGLVVNGATGKANNYIGRTYVDAISKMRDPLAKAGKLTESLNFIKWSYGYDYDFFPEKEGPHIKSMDYFHNEALRLLRIALMHDDPVARWHHVSRFRSNLSKQLVVSIKPDGSLFHHNMHYFAYGSMGINSVSGTLEVMSRANLAVTKPALDAAKCGAMQMRWYAGGKPILLALCGRHPSGTQNIPAGAFLNLAKAYAPYYDGKRDEDLISAYLRLSPDQAKKPEFADFKAEPAPRGFVSMPYAGLGLHRRDNWLAGVKGFSDFVASGESYANANRFGLYLSNGYLELLTHPTPLPTIHGSGTLPDKGFNWFALDGTTTIHSTLKKIANGNGSRHEKSGGTFNGGLSHDGNNGLFVQVINSSMQANMAREKGVKGEPFKATKSWFFFDSHIICLGSDISVDNVPYPVRTTLFQKFLTETFKTTTVNNEQRTLKDQLLIRNLKNNEPTYLSDPYGNSYFTAKGDPVQVRIGEQLSRNGYDNADTQGNYATAWIDHGRNPQSASYEYSILVQADSETATQWGEDLLKPETAPYLVLKKDKSAHIVFDRKSHTTAYVIFDPETPLPPETNSPLLKVARPCLVMVEDKGDHHLISLTNPNPRDHETEAIIISLTLKGTWSSGRNLPDGSAHVTTSISTDINDTPVTTRISIPIFHGESVTFKVIKK